MDDLLARMLRIRDDPASWLATGTRRVPRAADDLGLIGEPAVVARFTADDRQRRAAARTLLLVRELQGAELTFAEADALAADPAAMALVLSMRTRVYDEVRNAGRVALRCPRCSAEQTMQLADLARSIGEPPPPVAGADDTPALPALATFRTVGDRPQGISRAGSLTVALPAAAVGLHTTARSAVLGPPLTPAGDAAARRAWSKDGKPFDLAVSHRRWNNPGFRTILRAMQLCERLDDRTSPPLEVIEALPVVDVLFIDAVHHLLYATDVSGPAGRLICPSCGLTYLMVR